MNQGVLLLYVNQMLICVTCMSIWVLINIYFVFHICVYLFFDYLINYILYIYIYIYIYIYMYIYIYIYLYRILYTI